MRDCGWVAVVISLGGVLTSVQPAAAQAQDDAARVQRLAARLGSHNFHERETATRELDELGESALDALRQAARSDNAETRRRATELIDKIARRSATARMLAPTLIALNYEKTPLTRAVADLARRTGAPITLHGDPARFQGRTVTVTSGPVTFWQALQLFCHRADLHEWDGLSPLPPEVSDPTVPDHPTPSIGGVRILGQALARRGLVTPLRSTSPPIRYALLDGPGAALPAHFAGSVRVRALPPGTPFPTDVGKDILLPLQVSSEPRLNAHDALDLRVDRAIDEQGRALRVQTVRLEFTDEADDTVRRFNGRAAPPPMITRSGPVSVRIRQAETPAKRLRELAGAVTVQAFVAEPAVEMPRPAEAVGRIVGGEGNVALKLVGLHRLAGGEIQVIAAVQLPYGVQLAHGVGGMVGMPMRNGFGGQWGGMQLSDPDLSPAEGAEYQGLVIEDAQGRRFAAVNGAAEIAGLADKNFTVRVTATFRPAVKGAEPSRLVFLARRPAAVEVPFVLKDLLLP